LVLIFGKFNKLETNNFVLAIDFENEANHNMMLLSHHTAEGQYFLKK